MDDLISRHDAIDALMPIYKSASLRNRNVFSTARKCMAAIEDLPSAERDYKFDEWCTDCKEYDQERHCCPRFNAVIRRTIEELKADRKNGVWIEENTRPWSGQFYCSVCHRTAYDPQPTRAKGWVKRCRYAFCPNCGARMDGEENG